MALATRKGRPALGTLEPGQDVIVKLSPNDSRRRPREECYLPGRVRKVARVWIEIERVGDTGWPKEWRMRRDVQHEGSTYSGSNASFATLEQHAWDETYTWASGVLSAAGIRLDPGSPWRDREIELADLISKAEQ
jgi:hypothetical protein